MGRKDTRFIESGAIWGPTDVYEVRLPLPGDSEPIVLGQVLDGMEPDSEPVTDGKNDPMMPVAWTRTYDAEEGTARVFTTTMGASVDFANAALRRLIVNGCYWTLGMEGKIPTKSKVKTVGEFEPTFYGFGEHRKGLTPDDFRMEK